MRQVKFRFYDKLEKEMIYSNKSCLSEFFDDYDNSLPNAEIMQFTGLSDKKGVEVYEGDILKFKKEIGEVKYYESMAGYEVSTKYSYIIAAHFNQAEVIGNIYENPELLEKL